MGVVALLLFYRTLRRLVNVCARPVAHLCEALSVCGGRLLLVWCGGINICICHQYARGRACARARSRYWITPFASEKRSMVHQFKILSRARTYGGRDTCACAYNAGYVCGVGLCVDLSSIRPRITIEYLRVSNRRPHMMSRAVTLNMIDVTLAFDDVLC